MMGARTENLFSLDYDDLYMRDYLSRDELRRIGFGIVGDNVRISRKCSFYGVTGCIGDNSRIDDFCIMKGHVEVGRYVHIAAYSVISGAAGAVLIDDCVGLAPRCSIFTSSDDYASDVLNGPCVPREYVSCSVGSVAIGKAALVGTNCVILPRVVIGVGASIGAGCIVASDVPDGGVLRAQRPKLATSRRDWTAILNLVERLLP